MSPNLKSAKKFIFTELFFLTFSGDFDKMGKLGIEHLQSGRAWFK
jgi:hypothetical protein